MSGSVPLTGLLRSSIARRGDPLDATVGGELRVEHVLQLQQVGHVAGRVRALVVGERATQPVGEPVALGGGDLQLALQQRHQRRRAVAEEAGGELRVVQPRGHGAARRG